MENGHLQAIGLDARGRRQYRYHPQWRALQDQAKFERLAAFGRALARETVLATLVRYEDDEGQVRSVSSTDVNDYLRTIAGEQVFSAKDFRTWHGTVQALELTRLACEAHAADEARRYSAKDILAAVARQLGNTPAVCKRACIHPAVLALGDHLASDPEGLRALWARLGQGPRPSRLQAAEARLLAFLAAQRAASRKRTVLPSSLTVTS